MKLRTGILAGLVLAGALTPAIAQSRWDQAAVVAAFRAQLHRDPSPLELRRYALLVDRYNWSTADVKRDLAQRQDYRRYKAGTWDADAVVRSAYLDILGREPDPEGLRTYRTQIIKNGWSEWDLREELRRSPEYRSANGRTSAADRIVRRAYQDILHREPDPDGLANYRNLILEEGWDVQDVRWALRSSSERQELRQDAREMRRQDVDAVVRAAYRDVLGRDPDPDGMREYSERIRRDNWTQRDVERALRSSDEYRRKH